MPADESDAALHHQGNGLGGILPREELQEEQAERGVKRRKKKRIKNEKGLTLHTKITTSSLYSKAAAQDQTV